MTTSFKFIGEHSRFATRNGVGSGAVEFTFENPAELALSIVKCMTHVDDVVVEADNGVDDLTGREFLDLLESGMSHRSTDTSIRFLVRFT